MRRRTSDNRAYLASAIAFAKIHLRGTSDTLGTLVAIRLRGRHYEKLFKEKDFIIYETKGE